LIGRHGRSAGASSSFHTLMTASGFAGRSTSEISVSDIAVMVFVTLS
jgi:hypothetical protein